MRLQRILVAAVTMLCLGVVIAAQRSPIAHGQPVAKKHCHKVKKHGKKVKVCTSVKPRPTDTPVPTSTPVPTATNTPLPTDTPTATVTPSPTNTPIPRFLHQHDAVADLLTGVLAATSGFTYGDTDNYGLHPPAGQWYFWMVGAEENDGSHPYVSSYFNFEIADSSNRVYAPGPGYPSDRAGPTMAVVTIANKQQNIGWMEFTIPAQAAVYTVLWTEDGVIPGGVAVARVNVSGTGAVKLTSLVPAQDLARLRASFQGIG